MMDSAVRRASEEAEHARKKLEEARERVASHEMQITTKEDEAPAKPSYDLAKCTKALVFMNLLTSLDTQAYNPIVPLQLQLDLLQQLQQGSSTQRA